MTIGHIGVILALSTGVGLGLPATATTGTIQLAARLDLDGTTFAQPVEIVDGAAVTSWTFDLAYDASDVQVHVGCDSFSDAYCSLFTGPVTEGGFFASGAPLNLLVPGFVELGDDASGRPPGSARWPLLAGVGDASAQAVAVGPYYATPSWDPANNTSSGRS